MDTAVKRALLLIVASAVVYAMAASWAAARLPEDGVAMGVNAAGEVTKSTSRAGAITNFAALGGLMLVIAVVVTCVVWWIPLRRLSIPYKDYWMSPEHAAKVRQMIVWDAALIFSTALVALSFIPVNVALTTTDPEGTSALWRVVPSGLWLLTLACYAIWMILRRYRPGPEP